MDSLACAGNTSGRPVFDAARFDEQTASDPSAQQALAALFLRQADALAEELAAGCDAGEPAFGDALHRLKNTAHFVAGDRLLAAVRDAEAQGLAALPGARRAAAAHIAAELRALRDAISAWVRSQAPDAALRTRPD